MNRVQFTGRLVDDLERGETRGGTAVAKGRIAIDRAGQEGKPGFVNIESYGAGADAALRTIGKGWLIGFDGRLQHDQWQDRESGERRQALKFVGDIEFLARPQRDSNEREQEQTASNEQEQTTSAEADTATAAAEAAVAEPAAEPEEKPKSSSRGRGRGGKKAGSDLAPAEARASTSGAKEPEVEMAF